MPFALGMPHSSASRTTNSMLSTSPKSAMCVRPSSKRRLLTHMRLMCRGRSERPAIASASAGATFAQATACPRCRTPAVGCARNRSEELLRWPLLRQPELPAKSSGACPRQSGTAALDAATPPQACRRRTPDRGNAAGTASAVATAAARPRAAATRGRRLAAAAAVRPAAPALGRARGEWLAPNAAAASPVAADQSAMPSAGPWGIPQRYPQGGGRARGRAS
mmetsp:Transcript_52924/g.164383  ORF Transcript_52924/g.164383 Transcript_52924/m.164383 type:complete len:222 (+) Transcript_52924:1900-2565(+)